MKFSPLILLALASMASAAPPKCRPKTNAGNSSTVSASPSASPVAASDSAAPTHQATSVASSSAAPTGDLASVSLSEVSSSTASPTANAASATPSEVSSSGSTPAPTNAGNSTLGANPKPNYKPPSTKDEEWFLDPNVKPTLPEPIGPPPEVEGVIFPPGSVGVNPPDSGVPETDPIAQVFLTRFNEWRSLWGASPLRWNQTISSYAVDHAKKCQYEHFMYGDTSGQVLDTDGPIVKRDFVHQAKRSVDRWMVEGKEWDYNTQSMNNPQKQIGHWQVITTPAYEEVGCGWQECGNIYCDFKRNWTRQFELNIPNYDEHVYPRVEIPWDNYKVNFWQGR